jgi:cell wall-associated NlpC family hydrolase
LSASNTAGLRSGDVIFFAHGHGTETETIYHDAWYSGSGQMAYGVGTPVGITPVRIFSADKYRDAIRFRR